MVRGVLMFGLLISVGSIAAAGKFNKKLSVGDAAPDWAKLIGTDEKVHALADYESKLLVVVFTCNQCPIAAGYEERLNNLATDYKDKGVGVVAINVNRGKGESLEKMAQRATKQKFPFDYVKDESQASAKAYGARTTPTVFLLDPDRKIVYMGAFDDNWEAVEAVEHHYLVDAVDAVLAGNKPEVMESLAAGCGISYGQEDE